MKVNIQKYTKRFVPLLTALLVFVACICFPAGAEPLNYRDYETGVTVDGDNDIVTVTFPKEYCFVSMYAICDLDGDGYGGKEYAKSNPGTSITFPYCIGWTYSVLFYPTYLTYIDLSNIPNGTTFTFTVGVDYDSTAHFPTHTPKIQCSMRYYDDSLHDYVQQYTDNVRYDWDISSYSMVLDIPPGMSLGDPRIQLHGWGIPGDMDDYYPNNTQFGDFIVYLESFTATMSISSLYRLQEQSGKTNELLDEVNRQLEEQGKTMNDILNGTPEQNDQADQFKENADSAIGDLDNAGDKLNQVPHPTISAGQLVPNDVLLSDDYALYTSTLGSFWADEGNILNTVCVILGGLMLISYVLFGEKG